MRKIVIVFLYPLLFLLATAGAAMIATAMLIAKWEGKV